MSQPLTRDVTKLVEALEIVEAELSFQTKKLGEKQNSVTGSSSQERDHLADLASGYGVSRRYVGILLRYHRGRMARLGQTLGDRPAGQGISTEGRADAVTTDEDTPA